MELLNGRDAFVLVHPDGDPLRIAVLPLADLAGSGAVVAADGIAVDAADAEEECVRLARRHGLSLELDPRLRRLELKRSAGDGLFYLVVFPGGDTGRVSVAEAQWFDVQDYRLASDEAYLTAREADRVASSVAKRWGVVHEPSPDLYDREEASFTKW